VGVKDFARELSKNRPSAKEKIMLDLGRGSGGNPFSGKVLDTKINPGEANVMTNGCTAQIGGSRRDRSHWGKNPRNNQPWKLWDSLQKGT